MLLTTCPECSAQFKVQTEQLNIRQGRVMCGRCRHVFNAFETLTRIEDNAAQDGTVSDTNTIAETTSGAAQFNIPATSMPAPKLEADNAPTTPLAYDAFRAMGKMRAQADTKFEKNTLLNREQSHEVPNNWAWGLSAAALALLLLAQLVYFFRSPMVLAYPQFRPQLAAACKLVGCSISWGRDKESVVIESSDLVEPPGKPGQYLLTTVIANHGTTILDLPVLDMRLTDSNNQPLLRRVLQPAEYLGRPLKSDEGLSPGAQVYVNLSVAVDKKIVASGYAFDVFYP